MKRKKRLCLKVIVLVSVFTAFFLFFVSWSVLSCLSTFKIDNIRNNDNNRIVSIEFDNNLITDESKIVSSDKIKSPSKKNYEKLGRSSEIKSYEIISNKSYFSSNLISVTDSDKQDYGYFSFKGITENHLYDIDVGNIEVVEGVLPVSYEAENAVMPVTISSAVAERNGLSLGHQFNVKFFNHENENQFFEQKIKIVGIFSPSFNLNSFKEESNYTSETVENKTKHDETENQHKISEFDNSIALKALFLYEDYNNIYMSHDNLEILTKNISKAFSRTAELEYHADYILKANGSLNSFRKDVYKEIPNYFDAYGVNEAFESWMPSTSKNILNVWILSSIFLLVICLGVFLFSKLNATKKKKIFNQHIMIGQNPSYPYKCFFIKELFQLFCILILTSIFALFISKWIVDEFFTYVISANNTYYNVQYLYRDLIDIAHPLSNYVALNYFYCLGIFLAFIITSLTLYFSLLWEKKYNLKGVDL